MNRARSFSVMGGVVALAFVVLHPGFRSVRAEDDSAPIDPRVRAFLNTHCVHCHGSELASGDRRFDTLGDPKADASVRVAWEDVLFELQGDRMPPRGEPRPPRAERDEVAALLARDLAESAPAAAARSGLRRLSRFQYRHTLGDLLGLRSDLVDLSVGLPSDPTVDGFDNDASSLVISEQLLSQYLRAADAAIERATHFEDAPEPQSWVRDGPFHQQMRERGSRWTETARFYDIDRYRPEHDDPWTNLVGAGYRGGHAPFLPLRGGVVHSGIYDIRVLASAHHRDHDYDWFEFDFQHGDPLELQLIAVNHSLGDSHDYGLGRVDVLDSEPQWFEFRGWLERGHEPEVRFGNIGTSAKILIRQILLSATEEQPEFYELRHLRPSSPEGAHSVLARYRGPTLRIHRIEVRGPEPASWPPRGHRRMYGETAGGPATADAVLAQLEQFAELAYRRPLREGELQGIDSTVADMMAHRLTPLEALQSGLQAVLCSPGFLYLDESAGPEGELGDYALASRLSYFLFASLPDPPLLELAAERSLNDDRALDQQVERMLRDPRSDRFVEHFLDGWLELHNIERSPPSSSFLGYYRNSLDEHSRAEVRLLFRTLLDTDGTLMDLLDGEYALVNRPLAEHYGLPPVAGLEFRRVALSERRRGGLLGTAAFLTASANGVDTSPVVRGIFVHEKLLGRSPAPPPPGVPALEPDTRGATTVREQLDAHRADPSCASCHDWIDPPGFALESYDAIGGWREQYENGADVDASGEIAGEPFQDIVQFKDRLRERSDTFRRNLIEKLLRYALGRELGTAEHAAIDEIAERVQQRGDGLRAAVHEVVQSPLFRKP